MQQRPHRFTALLVSAALLSQTVVPPVVWGSLQDYAVGDSVSSTRPATVPAEAPSSLDLSQLDLASLTIPEQWAWVTETWQPPDQAPKGLVLHVQDLHVHPDVQLILSQLIGHFHDTLGIELVALEGAEGFCDTTLYSDLPDPASTERIAKLFLREGLFTGAEYYGIAHPGHVTLWGVEDEALYLEHLQVYQEGAGRLTESEDILTHLRNALAPLKAGLYPNALQRLLKLREAYERDDQNSFAPYLTELLRLANSAKLEVARYPHLHAATHAYELYDHLDMDQVQQDQERVLEVLRPQVSALERRQLNRLARSLRTGQDSSGRYYYETLARIAHAHGIVFSTDYPALSRYLTYLTLTRQLQSKALTEELEHLERAIEAAYLTTEQARALARLLKEVNLVDDLLHVKLSPRSFREYQRHRADITSDALWHSITVVTGHQSPVTSEQLERLVSTLPTHERFYDLAMKRDDALVRNTLKLLDARFTSHQSPVTVLITGGFHTPGLTDRFKAHDIAYAVLTPRSTGAFDEARYQAQLQHLMPSLEELFERFDHQALVPPLGLASEEPARFRMGRGDPAASDGPEQVAELPKRQGLLAYFVAFKTRLLVELGQVPELLQCRIRR